MPPLRKRQRLTTDADDELIISHRPRISTTPADSKRSASVDMPAPPDANPHLHALRSLTGFCEDLKAQLTCTICFRLLYQPYTSSCGHTHCYSCLTSWFNSNDNTHRVPTCPNCRAKITNEPAPAFLIRSMVNNIIQRPELLGEGESIDQHATLAAEEALMVENHADKPFENIFSKTIRATPLHDHEDGVERCPECNWELEGDACGQCGWPSYAESGGSWDASPASSGSAYSSDDIEIDTMYNPTNHDEEDADVFTVASGSHPMALNPPHSHFWEDSQAEDDQSNASEEEEDDNDDSGSLDEFIDDDDSLSLTRDMFNYGQSEAGTSDDEETSDSDGEEASEPTNSYQFHGYHIEIHEDEDIEENVDDEAEELSVDSSPHSSRIRLRGHAVISSSDEEEGEEEEEDGDDDDNDDENEDEHDTHQQSFDPSREEENGDGMSDSDDEPPVSQLNRRQRKGVPVS